MFEGAALREACVELGAMLGVATPPQPYLFRSVFYICH